MIWVFNLDRSAHLLFVGDGSLCVLYADSRYDELFEVNKLHRMEPEEPAEEEDVPPEFNPPPPTEP
jgi:hypothetical protein